MKTTTPTLNFALIIALFVASACSTTHQSDSASLPPTIQSPLTPAPASSAKSDADTLQGTWKGHELSGNNDGPCYLSVSGKNFEFRGADKNEWYKGTFTLREDTNPRQLLGSITECPAPRYVGKTSYAIYRLENNTLTLTAREPGNPDLPSRFDDSDARRFVFNGK